jgi:hypothetical protein
MSATDPYSKLTLSPEAQALVERVQTRLDTWIEDRVSDLREELSKKAEKAASDWEANYQAEMTKATEEFQALLGRQARIISEFQLKATVTQADLQELARAVDEHRLAIERQRAAFQKYGQVAGTVLKTALKLAI